MDDLSELRGLRAYPIPRRGMLMTGLISGFTLATERVEGQEIRTDTTGIEAGDTQIPTSDGKLPAYYAKPARKGIFPVILVNEEISAFTNTSRMFAGAWRRRAIWRWPRSITPVLAICRR